MLDALLIFPPQWSPFQPALSLPSLSAWLKRAGFTVRSLDLNLLFYEWLLSDECADLLLRRLAESDRSDEAKLALRALVSHAGDFRRDLEHLRNGPVTDASPDAVEYLESHYIAVKAFETYLDAVSQICGDFTISPYEFRLQTGNLNARELERQLAAPPLLLSHFLRKSIAQDILPLEPACIGISCIGQEQLYLSLLLGALLKERGAPPILVGGTILSRIFERGALLPRWFDMFFDVIVRNEGERPCEHLLANLRSGRPLVENVPSIVYAEGGRVKSSAPCAPLGVADLPMPDFDDLPLGRYVSAETTLPLLSSRGCYWGKCEFCHHGMVYGEKYQAYDAGGVLATVQALAARYGVRHFAFNDEAIPPKILRAMGRIFPPQEESGWNFTGLIKFERSFKNEDFVNLYAVGFRSLYVGLESASERVLTLMRKPNTQETIARNLRQATGAGIWMHCFLFFGFPGETDEDAQETYDFVISSSDIISSFGSATFALEHNAPIFHHLDDFGLKLRPLARDDVDVYYEYDVGGGVDAERALDWMNRLNEKSRDIPRYNAAGWVPREVQLCLLSALTPSQLVELGLRMRDHGGMPLERPVAAVVTRAGHPTDSDATIAVNRVNGRVLVVRGNTRQALDLCHDHGTQLHDLRTWGRRLFDALAYRDDRLTAHAVSSPVPTPL